MCESCRLPLTVKHILVEYTNLPDVCVRYVCSVKELLESIDSHTVIDLIKEIHYYNQL